MYVPLFVLIGCLFLSLLLLLNQTHQKYVHCLFFLSFCVDGFVLMKNDEPVLVSVACCFFPLDRTINVFEIRNGDLIQSGQSKTSSSGSFSHIY